MSISGRTLHEITMVGMLLVYAVYKIKSKGRALFTLCRLLYHIPRPNTVTTQYMVLLWSLCLSPGHFIVATPSVTVSQLHESAECTPAPFFA